LEGYLERVFSSWQLPFKANLKQCTRCKISITRNNLLDVLWQILEASDEIDLKPSLRACSQGLDFISMRNANKCFFINSLNKKRMNGRSKIFGPHACLRVNNFSFLW